MISKKNAGYLTPLSGHQSPTAHLNKSCWLGRICSSLLVFFSLKVRTAGEGLEVYTLMMPMGKDRVMSPVIFTMHLWRAVQN